MPKSENKLNAISQRVRSVQESRVRLEEEAAAWVSRQLADEERALEDAVMAALDDQHSIADVARAYTISGKTPNRNKIYEIKRKRGDRITDWVGEYPFVWSPRIVKTRDGQRTVYDIIANTNAFGPDEITGVFEWRYDSDINSVEPKLFIDREPYPTTDYYRTVLTKWLLDHPYPEED